MACSPFDHADPKIDTVIAHVTGGLGNQMFQYGAAFALAKQIGARPAIDTSWYQRRQEPNRSFQLGAFQLGAPVVTQSPAMQVLFRLALAQRPVARFLGALVRPCLRLTVLREPAAGYTGSFPDEPSRKRVLLHGYWQSYALLEQHAEALKNEYRFASQPHAQSLNYLPDIEKTESVSLHIRRGDFLTARPGSVLGLAYYRDAADYIRQHVTDTRFYVFSDDLMWCRQNLELGATPTFVEVASDASGIEDLRLMSACKHHIIANSSFSWWGAWLGQSRAKIVVAPKVWHPPEARVKPNPYPPSWHII